LLNYIVLKKQREEERHEKQRGIGTGNSRDNFSFWDMVHIQRSERGAVLQEIYQGGPVFFRFPVCGIPGRGIFSSFLLSGTLWHPLKLDKFYVWGIS